MKIKELYEHYEYNWAKMSRELKFGSTTIKNWRDNGYIPFVSQKLIEKRTGGLFKARMEDLTIEFE